MPCASSTAAWSRPATRWPRAATQGIPIDGALGYIDDRFGGALTELNDAGLYPDDAGTARYLRAPENVYPVGAILLGLGEFGRHA